MAMSLIVAKPVVYMKFETAFCTDEGLYDQNITQLPFVYGLTLST